MVQKSLIKQKAIYSNKQRRKITNLQITNLLLVKRGIPQRSVLRSLLFLIYINDLQFLSDVLDPIMFSDDTNLF